MNIREYIETGIVESYVLGLASAEEGERFERLSEAFPELKIARSEFEFRLEAFATRHEVPPPAGIREKIEDRLRELPAIRPVSRGTWSAGAGSASEGPREADYLAVEGRSTHIKVHRIWRPVFIGVFILSKILLALAIYFFLKYQNSVKEVQQLQQQQPRNERLAE